MNSENIHGSPVIWSFQVAGSFSQANTLTLVKKFKVAALWRTPSESCRPRTIQEPVWRDWGGGGAAVPWWWHTTKCICVGQKQISTHQHFFLFLQDAKWQELCFTEMMSGQLRAIEPQQHVNRGRLFTQVNKSETHRCCCLGRAPVHVLYSIGLSNQR